MIHNKRVLITKHRLWKELYRYENYLLWFLSFFFFAWGWVGLSVWCHLPLLFHPCAGSNCGGQVWTRGLMAAQHHPVQKCFPGNGKDKEEPSCSVIKMLLRWVTWVIHERDAAGRCCLAPLRRNVHHFSPYLRTPGLFRVRWEKIGCGIAMSA